MSITIISWVLLALNWLTVKFSIPVAPGDLDTTVHTLIAFFTVLGIYWGRYRKGDITWYGARKK